MKEFICGVNYWPRKTGVHMWKEWDAESIDAEFRQMAELSLNACRVFLLWEDFQPDPYRAVSYTHLFLAHPVQNTFNPKARARTAAMAIKATICLSRRE